ncbi:hypothetical protein JR316_0005158 [Psilocybe cubensis]|uniref:Uncharacterized protein n=2 Tax=Psilocybe cubensis TaxID=181762 RepID=A0ACB8H5K4_PSICU|nr:hypothetical protein JR316_0005158 [Psilocybe cubensis]KAH9483058.1 hypothetical protein JR316_0005158 [Psilocybe cubensis]
MKFNKPDPPSSRYLQDIARDQLPPPSLHRSRHGSIQDPAQDYTLPHPSNRRGRREYVQDIAYDKSPSTSSVNRGRKGSSAVHTIDHNTIPLPTPVKRGHKGPVQDIAQDRMSSPSSIKRGRKGSNQDIAQEQRTSPTMTKQTRKGEYIQPPIQEFIIDFLSVAQDLSKESLPSPLPAKKGRNGFMKFLSKAVPCTSAKSVVEEPSVICSQEVKSVSSSPPSQSEVALSRNKFSTDLIPTRGSFSISARESLLPQFSPEFNSMPGSSRAGHRWPSFMEIETPVLEAGASPRNIVPSPSSSLSAGRRSIHAIVEDADSEPVQIEPSSGNTIAIEVPADRQSDHATNTSSDEEPPAPTKMSWADILAAMKNNAEEDASSVPINDLEEFLSAFGLKVSKKEPAVEEMSLFQLNKVVTDHEERDAQTIMDWLLIHPEATGFMSSYPALTRLVEVDADTNEIVNTTSFVNITADLEGEGMGQTVGSMDSLPSVYSQQTSPTHSVENIPQLIFTLPTETDLALDPVMEEETVPAPELLNVAWTPTPMQRRRVYSVTPPKRRISRLRKVASAPDLQLVAAGSSFDDSDDEDTVPSSREVSGVSSTVWTPFSIDSSVDANDSSTMTVVSEEERRKSDPNVGENMLVANLLPDSSLGSFSSNRGRVSVIDAGTTTTDPSTASLCITDVVTRVSAEDDGVSVSGFVSAPSTPAPDAHTFESTGNEAVEASSGETQVRSRPVGIYGGPLNMASLRSQMNKVEEIIIANASNRASMSAPSTPQVQSPGSPKRDSQGATPKRRGSMGYKPRAITGIRPLMLPMRVALRDFDDDGNRTVTHPPGTVSPEDSPRNIVPF